MSYSTTFLKSRTLVELVEMANLKDGPVETGLAAFDNAAENGISVGNVASRVQLSRLITRDDLPLLKNLPDFVQRAVEREASYKDVFFYAFSCPQGKERVTQAFLITDMFHRHVWSRAVDGPMSHLVLDDVMRRVSWFDSGMDDPYPTSEIVEATAHFDVDAFAALAKDYGFNCIAGQEPEWPSIGMPQSEGRIYFRKEKPFMTWIDGNVSRSLTRSETPAEAAALLVLRTGGDLERLKAWSAENAPAPDVEMSPM